MSEAMEGLWLRRTWLILEVSVSPIDEVVLGCSDVVALNISRFKWMIELVVVLSSLMAVWRGGVLEAG